MPFRTVALILSLLCLNTARASAQSERILMFQSDIELFQDRRMIVTETLTFEVTNQRIRHGIYRDIPTLYQGPMLLRKKVPFAVTRVTLDGADEPYTIENAGQGVRIRIGRQDRTVPPGRHTYTISYQTGEQIGSFKDHDELYWHVTGTQWDFPIDQVVARVKLPRSVPRHRLQLEAYTGPKGSKAHDYTAELDPQGVAVFRTTRPLEPGGNMSIVLSWPKGAILEPSPAEVLLSLASANAFGIVALIGTAVLWIYYHVQWMRVGRDPPPGIIEPTPHPPEGISPAGCRFLTRRRYDHKCFIAALFDLAAAGIVRVHESAGSARSPSHVIERADADLAPMAADEQVILDTLLADQSSIALTPSNRTRITAAIKAHEHALRQQLGHLFRTNRRQWAMGLIVAAGVGVSGLLSAPPHAIPVVAFLSFWLSFWSVGVVILLLAVANAWKGVRSHPLGILGALFLTAFATPFVIAEIVVIGILSAQTSVLFAPVLVLMGVIIVVYARLLEAPTVEGRRILDAIEGFCRYLDSADTREADSDRLELYLPFAVALDRETEWSRYFERVIAEGLVGDEPAAHRATAATPFFPAWYVGERASSSSFVRSLSSSLSSSITSSTASPGSSSGRSGGGSSGGSGGGGGGGGGGW
ncbi:MAG: DUF2207 domain-containing protein [Phycisphaerales bacterium]